MSASRTKRRPLPAVLLTLVLMVSMAAPAIAQNGGSGGDWDIDRLIIHFEDGAVFDSDVDGGYKIDGADLSFDDFETFVHISCSEDFRDEQLYYDGEIRTVEDFWLRSINPGGHAQTGDYCTDDFPEDPEEVEIELAKLWFDVDGELLDEAPQGDAVTLTSGEDSINEGESITLEEGSSYAVSEDLAEGWSEVACSEDHLGEGVIGDGTGDDFSADASGEHVVCNQEEEDDTPPPPPEPGDGEVTVEKNVIGDAPLVLEDFPFEVVCNGSTEASFSLGDGESDSTNVGDGSTCTVVETDAQGAGVSWTIDDDVTGEGTETDEFEVNEGDDIVVTFTNDFGAVLGTALIAVDFDKVWTGDDAELDDVTVEFDVEVDGVAVGTYAPGDELELELHEGALTEVEITGETVEGFADANELCEYTPAFPDAEPFDFDSEGATLTVTNEVECAEVLAEVEVEEEEEEVLPKTGASTTALAILGLLGMAAGSLLLRRRPGQVI